MWVGCVRDDKNRRQGGRKENGRKVIYMQTLNMLLFRTIYLSGLVHALKSEFTHW